MREYYLYLKILVVNALRRKYILCVLFLLFFLPIESLLCNTCYVLALNYLLCSTYKKVNVLVPRLVVHAQLLHNFRAGYKTGHSRN